MTTTKSFYSLTINALLRLKGIAIVYTLLSFILYPLQVYFQVSPDNWSVPVSLYGESNIYPIISYILYFVLIIVAAIILPLFASSFMHKKQSATLFHSLPVSRLNIYFSNLVATLIVYTVPMALSYLISGLLINANSAKTELALTCFKEFGMSLNTGFILISLTFLCAVLASSTFDTFVLSAVFSVIIPCLYLLHKSTLSLFLYGYYSDIDYNLLAVSPVINRFDIEYSFGIPLNINPYIFYPFVALIFIGLSILAYQKRKTEFAENQNLKAIIYKIVVVLAVYAISIVGTFISFGFSMENDTSNVISTFAFALVSAICLCAIFSRNFKQNKHSIITIAVSVIIPVVYVLFVFTGWFNFENIVPESDNVESVEIYIPTYNLAFNINDNYQDGFMTIKSEENIQSVIELHNYFLENKDTEELSYANAHYTRFEVVYKMKNGTSITRSYYNYLDYEQLETIAEMNNTDEVKMISSIYQNLDISQINFLSIASSYDATTETYLTQAEIETLWEAMVKDDFERNYSDLVAETGECYSMITTNFALDNASYEDNNFYITDSCVNTIAALKELGLDYYTESHLPDDFIVTITTMSYYNSWMKSTFFYNNFQSISFDTINESYTIIEEDDYDEMFDKISLYSDIGSDTFLVILTEASTEDYEYYGYDQEVSTEQEKLYKTIAAYALND